METVAFFGDWLRLRRESLGLSRPEVAHCVGCSVSALRKIEANERRPSEQLAGLLARCLQIPDAERSTFTHAARGAVRVDRLGHPVQAGADRLPGDRRPPLGRSFPIPATLLIGRTTELATLSQLLNDPRCRLLTLVGPGGIGKTRLALELACNEWQRFADGAFFVPLASISASEFLVPAIAQVIGCNFSGLPPPRVQLASFLRDKQLLLLLDNLEHLLNGVELLSELLEKAPRLTLLTTSRERLELHGEWVFEVDGLPVPALDQQAGLENYSALQLFEQRARQTKLSFALSDANRADVVRICHLLDGMPLAIELAAAWVAVLSCAEIVAEIVRGLDILGTTRRDVPGRQRSMRAVFDHSWRLLEDEERRVVAALSVFHGGLRREAAEAVVGAKLPVLSTLVGKSFLRRNAEGRYYQHGLVRQYCLGRLLEDPEEDKRVRERHGLYYTDFVTRLESDLKGKEQRAAVAAIDSEIDNIRVASRWAIRNGALNTICQMGRSFWQYYDLTGRFQEAEAGFRWAVAELERAPSARDEGALSSSVMHSHARAQQAWFCVRLGRFEVAQQLLPPSLEVLRAAGAWRELVDALHHAGALARLTGDYAHSRVLFEEMLQLATLTDDRWNVTIAEGNIGLAAAALGDYEEGRARMAATIVAFREIGDQRMLAISLHFLGELLCELKAYEEAERCENESLALSRDTGDRWIYAMSLRVLGRIALESGDSAAAVARFRGCVTAAKEIEEHWTILQGLKGLGSALLVAGEVAESLAAFCEGLERAWAMQAMPDVLAALLGITECSMQQERASNASLQAALLAVLVVSSHPATSQHSREKAHRLWSQLEAGLSTVQIEAARANVQNVPLAELVSRMLPRPVLASELSV